MAGNESDFLPAEPFTIALPSDTTAPTFPSDALLYPINGATLLTPRPAFDWSDAGDSESGVLSYTIVITALSSTDSTSQIEAPATTYTFTTTESNFTPDFDLPEGDYIWTVKAHDVSGNVSEFVASEPFTIKLTVYIYLPLINR